MHSHSILLLFSAALVAHVDSWGTSYMLLVNVSANVYNIPNIYTNFRLQSLEIWYYLRWSEYNCPNKPNFREIAFHNRKRLPDQMCVRLEERSLNTVTCMMM